ncbi:alkylated DNA repair protein AlkB [Lichtheimia ornata]|uniref:Alkylated DNA repair protein AlkB n=1 Tax=Lichtheimia ornata TaxID=688661 RepID=A0AAD7V387_9FUNG|nr:alkylated DNA repair protein AlkB [Lichtheimia ornata]KAJ8658257.1 alkylated DNA repair protein AlkB [Lichtheimia ornata]
MSNKNQYNVLVDMDEGGYTQPATIESDGLEFQDFSSNTGQHGSAPPPPPPAASSTTNFFDTQESRRSGSNKAIWSLDYYSQYFDVDTSQVIERCLKTLYPVGDFASDTLNNQPDLYGPFWIATTVVFAMFVCSSLAGSLAAYIADVPHQSDFRLLSYAVGVVYSYGFLCPALVWLATKYFGCQPSLLEIVNYYGYGLTVWIPVSVLCVMPFDIARWVFVGVAALLTGYFLVKNLYIVISKTDAKTSRILLLAILEMQPSLANKDELMSSRRQRKILERQQLKAAQLKQDTKTYVNQSPFRYVERNFKSRVPPPDYSKVIDLHQHPNHDKALQVDLACDLSFPLFEQKTPSRAYVLHDIPGLVIIPNPFSHKGQRQLIRECLSLYTRPPNTSNLDTHYAIPDEGLWPLCEKEHRGQLDPSFVVPRKTMHEWQLETNDSEKHDPPPVDSMPLLRPFELMHRMRWVTLGYQYHWPTKTYHFDKRYPMPKLVDQLTSAIAYAVDGVGQEGVWKNTYRGEDFKAEAGVVNYYQYRDALMGHVDRSELNMDAPLISVSLGNSCIYVIGGTTQDTEPVPLALHSGDIVVMTKPCRKFFHGVPRIIEDTLPEYLSAPLPDTDEDDDWELYSEFLKTSRININVRQVFPP